MSHYARWSPDSRSPRPAEAAYRRRREARARRAPWAEFADPARLTLARIADPERLIAAYAILRAEGGAAPGPDGVTYDDLGPREVAAIGRDLAPLIARGRYEPGARRAVSIPKPGGRGTRTLRIGNLLDRLVGKALALALTPAAEARFSTGSHGFRPGRSHLTMLAALEHAIAVTGMTTLAVDDVRDAFGSVAIADALARLRPTVRRPGVLKLAEALVRGGGPDRDRTRGLAQGDPLSPLLLNLLLHHIHDVPLDAAVTDPPWSRYADNLAYLGRDVPGGRSALQRAGQLLARVGLALKGQDGAPVDLRHDVATCLGFQISWADDRLRSRLGDESWHALEDALARAHLAADPAQAAQRAADGWIAATGPAAESGRESEILDRLLLVAARSGFRELSRESLRARCRQAHRQWERLRRGARTGRWTGDGHGQDPGGSAASVATGPAH